MTKKIESQFKIDEWNETTISDAEEGPKLIRASVKQSYSGEMEGKSTLEYLMSTFDEDFTSYIGTEHFHGRVSGLAGSFLLNHEGTHENGVAKSKFTIVPGSGTGELRGILGQGEYEATHEEVSCVLEYRFE